MLISTGILGWIGILIFLIIIFTFLKLIKRNEFAFLHISMAFMYAMWFPLPVALYELLNSKLLLVGTIFGFIYLMLIVITMTLQAGHLTFMLKHNPNNSITNTHGDYMMSTLSNPFEGVANIFKSIWALFLGFAFWSNGDVFLASIMFLFTSLIFYYLPLVVATTLLEPIKLFSKVKNNTFFVNIETLLFFVVLISYLTLNL